MGRNFRYAPGLPGYGTRGSDGSVGLQGLAFYFSEFSGTTDTVILRTKIIANKILFSIDELLPNYPDRVYQTGDLFVDKNGDVWKIDLTATNRYVETNGSFTGQDFFQLLKNVPAIGYDRYSNDFINSKALVDNVLRTGGATDYTSAPQNIYISEPDQFAQWKYVNVLSAGNSGLNYYPFTVYSIGVDDPGSIALVRDQSVNVWRLGNLDFDGAQRTTDFALDFNYIRTFDGSVFLGYDGGDFKFVSGTGGNGSLIATGGDGGDFLIYLGGGGDAGTNPIAGNGGGFAIYGGDGGDGASAPGIGGSIIFKAGESGESAGNGLLSATGYIQMYTGAGATSLIPYGGDIIMEAKTVTTPSGTERGRIRMLAYDVSIGATNQVQIKSENDVIRLNSNPGPGVGGLRGSLSMIDVSLFSDAFSSNVSKMTHYYNSKSNVSGVGPGTVMQFMTHTSGYPTIAIRNAQTDSISPAMILQVGFAPIAGTYCPAIVFRDNDGNTHDILEFNSSGARFQSTSDARLKGNIKDISLSGLNLIESIPIKQFQMRTFDASGNITDILEQEVNIGYVAQDLKNVYEAAITYRDNTDPNSIMGVDKVSMIPILHKAIQELSKENKDLKSRLLKLEDKVSQLIN